MRRKLIKQGKSALTITLPVKWVKKQGLEAGDELEVETKKNDLLIHAKNQSSKKLAAKVEINNSLRTLQVAICSLYRVGADAVAFSFSDTHAISIIQKQIEKQLIGFEILSQTSDSCQVKSLAGITEDNYNNVMKRIFFLLESLSENIMAGILNKDLDLLRNVYYIDRTVNKSSNYVARMLTKINLDSEIESHFIFAIARQLEELADHYRDLGLFLAKEYYMPTEETLCIMKQVNTLLSSLAQSFFTFHFSLSEIIFEELKDQRNHIKKKLNKSSEDNVIITYLLMILESMKGIMVKIIDMQMSKLINKSEPSEVL